MKIISIVIGDITRFGGTERAVTNLANLLVQNYRICIVSIYEPSASVPHFLLNEQVTIEYLKLKVPKNNFKKNFHYLQLIFSLRSVVKRKNPDFVISTAHAFSFMLPFVVLFHKAKSIAAEHITRTSLPFFSILLQRISYPFLHAVVLLSHSAGSRYSFCKNTHVIPNSLPFFPAKPAELNNKLILSVGRISYEKGFDRLVDVATLIKNNHQGWKIWIFGNGPLEADIKKAIDDNDLSDFLLVNNAVTNIEAEYLNSSIYVMTSRFEAFPMVLLEAQACGLPVIAYNCPEGPKEIVKDGYDGFLIEDGNAESMVEKLSLLMINDELRKKLGVNARNSVADYKDEAISVMWNNLLSNI